jgi:[ribosomal protein S18]-alanine N-acetyltransferase
VAEPAGVDPQAVEVHLVPLRRRHLRAVLKVEAQVYPKPWSLPLFMSELNLRNSRHYVAARVDGTVVGYAGLMYVADEGHVTTIAVDPVWQRHKIGSRLLLNLARAALRHGAHDLTLEVRVTNTPAQTMYRRFGFETEGIRKNYYAEINEDAMVMWAHHIDSADYTRRLADIEAAIPGATIDETAPPE